MQKKPAGKSPRKVKVRKARTGGPIFLPLDVRLHSIRLLGCASTLHVVDNKLPSKIKLGVNALVGMRNDEPMISVLLGVTVTGGDEKGKSSRIEVGCRYEGLYEYSKKPSKDEANAVGVIGTLALWPYVREFVSSTTSRMGIRPLTLPMVRINAETGAPEFVSDESGK